MNEDLSSIFEKLNINKDNISPEMINNLMNMFGNNSEKSNSNTNTSTENNDSSNNGIDLETIMKMKAIIDKLNVKDDPRSNLLQSLKPYLKESRQSKVDQYIKLMNMSKVMEVLPLFGGDQPNVTK